MHSEKACTKCKTVKPAAAFQRRLSARSGLASWCRLCRQDYTNGVYAPAKRAERKKRIIALKGGKCQGCGGVFPHFVFDLHHRDPSTKDINMTDLQDKSWSRVLAELSKCDLLCANCHRLAHHSAKPDPAPTRGPNRDKKRCNSGHLLAGDNIYIYRGHRHCRLCNRARVAEYRQRSAAQEPRND